MATFEPSKLLPSKLGSFSVKFRLSLANFISMLLNKIGFKLGERKRLASLACAKPSSLFISLLFVSMLPLKLYIS